MFILYSKGLMANSSKHAIAIFIDFQPWVFRKLFRSEDNLVVLALGTSGAGIVTPGGGVNIPLPMPYKHV